MIIKLTLVGLILVLVAVIVLSYYKNKEYFEDITPNTSECSGTCPKTMTSANGKYTLSATMTDSFQGTLVLKDVSNNTMPWRQPQLSASSPPISIPRNTPFEARVNSRTGEFGLYNTTDQSTLWKTDANSTRNAPYKLFLKDDGNLVTKNGKGEVVWSTNIVPPSAPPTPSAPAVIVKTNECKVGKCSSLLEAGDVKLMLQHDGVLMLQSPTAPAKVIAKAMNKGLNGPYTLFLGQNGNLMILDKMNDQTKPVWSSNSFRADDSQIGTYRAVLAEDGSFTIRNGSGKIIWSADDGIPKPQPKPMPQPQPIPDPDVPSSGSMPDRTDITPDNQISNTGSMAMALKYKSDLLKDLQKVIRNEFIANRMTEQLEREDNDANDDTDAMAQGREYGCRRKDMCDCPKSSDRSDCRKENTPCFGCPPDY
jgi:hypothetical protein